MPTVLGFDSKNVFFRHFLIPRFPVLNKKSGKKRGEGRGFKEERIG
jgi:hypothetical protein